MRLNFILSAIAGVILGCFSGGCGKSGGPAQPPVRVRVAQLAPREFLRKVRTQGVIESIDHATLSALTPGRLVELRVKEGDAVKKGELLFRIDSSTLENRRRLAQEMLKMARERNRTRSTEVNIAKLKAEKAEIDYKRSLRLVKTNAVSKDSFETAELNFRSAKLNLAKAEAAMTTALAEIDFAQSTLEIAEKNLSDTSVYAPYDGTITAKKQQLNEFCNAGTPVLLIDSPRKKRAAVRLSGLYFPMVKAKAPQLEVQFGSGKPVTVPVNIISEAIDPISRTFEIKADLPENFQLPSGTLVEVAVILERRRGKALPEEALLFRSGGKFAVFTVEQGKAREVAVTPGITTDGFTEILNGAALNGKWVIVSGHYFVNDGSPLLVTQPQQEKK